MGPVIQAKGRLTFEDDLRSGGLLCFISMSACVRTELADSIELCQFLGWDFFVASYSKTALVKTVLVGTTVWTVQTVR